MTSDRWRRIEQIYEAALQREPRERSVFLESACRDDQALRRDVERLLAANEKAGDFLASPAWEVAPAGLGSQTMTVDRDTSLVGRQVGHYSVLSLLGRGGMGEVYRARDSKLNREVALKVLPDLFALNPDRLARFKREAHVLASLNHPNIAAIYGLEESGDVKALVLELVEGQTLADRITRGRLPLDEALPIARQMADALEAAHERGVIHRDLKPANIKVRADGIVKVLDFGLAKALEPPSSGIDPSQSPTITSSVATREGIILGTAAYMAPEQARGKSADRHADLWAFGCVLYEMLTGRRAFPGEGVSETLAAVIRGEPDWRALTDETPPPIRRLLRRCLAKDTKGRLTDASTARIEIDEALNGPTDAVAVATTLQRRERFLWASTVALVAAVAVVAIAWALRPAPPPGEMRFEITTPPTTDPGSLAISPDGRKIVFVATSQGRSMLWLHLLESGTAAPLAGTDDAVAPFWSPDSRSVGFSTATDNQLKRIEIVNGSLQALGTVAFVTGGTWNREGTILFATRSEAGPIFRISSEGGEASAVTRLEGSELIHQFPHFLPDGRHFLYHRPNLDPPGVYVGQLDGSETQRLIDADAAAVYDPSGYLLFLRQRTLYAQAFDPDRLRLTGDAVRVAERVADSSQRSGPSSGQAVSVSATRTLVYRRASTQEAARPLVWFDRSGNETGRVSVAKPGFRPDMSRDGTRVALMGAGIVPLGPPEIWQLRVDSGGPMRVTSNGKINLDPVWSPNGSQIVFSSSTPTSGFNLYRKSMTSDGKEELLLATQDRVALVASDWSIDGFLLYGRFDPKGGTDIWALPPDGDRKPFPVVQTDFVDRFGQFSPDGKWIAYESDETGRFEVYGQSFRGSGYKAPISPHGGAQVRWRSDGRELFYIALDGQLMAVRIRFSPDGQTFETDAPTPLFRTRVGGAVQGLDRQQYVVSRDGQRFLMSILQEDPSPSPITVILNWRPKP